MTTLIIWDFDGTLADTRPWIYASYRYAARESGFPEPSDEQLSHHCCGGIFDNLEVLFGKTGEEAEAMAALLGSIMRRTAWIRCVFSTASATCFTP